MPTDAMTGVQSVVPGVTQTADGSFQFGAPSVIAAIGRGAADIDSPAFSGDGSVVVFGTDSAAILPSNSPEGDVVIQVGKVRTHPYPDGAMSGPNGTRYHALAPDISRDGRYVLFTSNSPKLVPGDRNRQDDLFVYDRLTKALTRIDTTYQGGPQSVFASPQSSEISGNGRYVTFRSYSNQLVTDDHNVGLDVFVHDLTTHVTTRVNVSSTGQESESVNDYGQGPHSVPVSADGRFIAFSTRAGNLVPDDTNGITDVFVRDRQAGTTERITLRDDGGQVTADSDPGAEVTAISDDGRYVAFETSLVGLGGVLTPHLRDVFLRDRATGTTRLVSQRGGVPAGADPSNGGDAKRASMTPDGRIITFVSNSMILSPNSSQYVLWACDTATTKLARAKGPVPAFEFGPLTNDGHHMLNVIQDLDQTALVLRPLR